MGPGGGGYHQVTLLLFVLAPHVILVKETEGRPARLGPAEEPGSQVELGSEMKLAGCGRSAVT
jgi:hypothetical protein